MIYTPSIVCEILSISPSTLRNYSEAAKQFLSAYANPERGKHRSYTEDDLRVLVVLKTSPDYEAAILSLSNGVRGDLPTGHGDYSLAVHSRDQIMLLQNRIQQLEAQVEQLQSERDKRIRAEGQLELVQNMLRDAHEEIIRLRSQK